MRISVKAIDLPEGLYPTGLKNDGFYILMSINPVG
jgi:hypothetical protein